MSSNTAKTTNPVGLVTINSVDFVHLAFECLRAAQTIVPVRSPDDRYRLTAASVSEVREPKAQGGWFDETLDLTPSTDVAQILFTSGTEGEPKAVQLSFAAICDVVTRLNEVMQVDASIREYIGVPVYLSFGFGRCRAVAAVGGKSYIPENGFDPLEIAEMLARGEINALSAVPSLLRILLGETSAFKDVGHRLRWIEIGSQFMATEEKSALRELFPNAIIVQHYGLTEASRSTFLKIHEAEDDALGSVGKPTGQVDVKISEGGRILIKGPHVTSGLMDSSGTRDPRNEEGWYPTQDLGSIKNGYLYFEGRADDLINCGGTKLSPEAVEARVRELSGKSGAFAICGVPDPLRGERVLLAIPEGSESERQSLLKATLVTLEEYGLSAAGAVVLWSCSTLPQTDSGKIQRKELASQYAKADSPTESPASVRAGDEFVAPANEEEARIAKLWQETLKSGPVSVTQSFTRLGGDSMMALRLLLQMSRSGIDRQVASGMLRGASIRQIASASTTEASAPATEQIDDATATVRALNLVRGLLVLAVILGHWSLGVFDRLPESFRWLSIPLAPYFGSGTQGFAIVFGLGVGLIHMPRMPDQMPLVRKGMTSAAMMVGLGILVIVMARQATALLQGESIDSTGFFGAFFGPLLFYFLALLGLPWILSAGVKLGAKHRPWLWGLFACGSLGLSLLARHFFLDNELEGIAQLGRLMLVARFSIPLMMTGVFIGIGIGSYLQAAPDIRETTRPLVLLGVSLVTLAVIIGAFRGELHVLVSWPTPRSPWRWLLHTGGVAILMAWFSRLASSCYWLSGRASRPLQLFSVVGQLALPLYVLQAVVLPLKSLLSAAGLSDGPAIALVLLAFAAAAGVMTRGLYALTVGTSGD